MFSKKVEFGYIHLLKFHRSKESRHSTIGRRIQSLDAIQMANSGMRGTFFVSINEDGGFDKVKSFPGYTRYEDPMFHEIFDLNYPVNDTNYTLRPGVEVYSSALEQEAIDAEDSARAVDDISVQEAVMAEDPEAFGGSVSIDMGSKMMVGGSTVMDVGSRMVIGESTSRVMVGGGSHLLKNVKQLEARVVKSKRIADVAVEELRVKGEEMASIVKKNAALAAERDEAIAVMMEGRRVTGDLRAALAGVKSIELKHKEELRIKDELMAVLVEERRVKALDAADVKSIEQKHKDELLIKDELMVVKELELMKALGGGDVDKEMDKISKTLKRRKAESDTFKSRLEKAGVKIRAYENELKEKTTELLELRSLQQTMKEKIIWCDEQQRQIGHKDLLFKRVVAGSAQPAQSDEIAILRAENERVKAESEANVKGLVTVRQRDAQIVKLKEEIRNLTLRLQNANNAMDVALGNEAAMVDRVSETDGISRREVRKTTVGIMVDGLFKTREVKQKKKTSSTSKKPEGYEHMNSYMEEYGGEIIGAGKR